MSKLDRDAAALQAPKPAEPVPADIAVRYLRELPKTWAGAKGGKGRGRIRRRVPSNSHGTIPSPTLRMCYLLRVSASVSHLFLRLRPDRILVVSPGLSKGRSPGVVPEVASALAGTGYMPRTSPQGELPMGLRRRGAQE